MPEEFEGISEKINDEENVKGTHLNEVASKYINDCIAERSAVEKCPIAKKLLEAEIVHVQTTGRISAKEQFADVYRQKTIKLSQKVFVPTNEFPKFNFVGKILGPGGNSLKRLQEETKCKIVILGRNSMRDRAKEEELRNSGDPKYGHLNQHLHVEVSAIAAPAEAYAKIAYALEELRKYITPDKFDDIRQEQLKELMEGPEGEKHRAKMEASARKYEIERATTEGHNKHSYAPKPRRISYEIDCHDGEHEYNERKPEYAEYVPARKVYPGEFRPP